MDVNWTYCGDHFATHINIKSSCCTPETNMRFVTCTGDRDQDHPHGKEMQTSKMAVWGGLTNSCEKKRSEKQRRKGKI